MCPQEQVDQKTAYTSPYRLIKNYYGHIENVIVKTLKRNKNLQAQPVIKSCTPGNCAVLSLHLLYMHFEAGSTSTVELQCTISEAHTYERLFLPRPRQS